MLLGDEQLTHIQKGKITETATYFSMRQLPPTVNKCFVTSGEGRAAHDSISVRSDMPRTCVNNADDFCYVCGNAVFAGKKQKITPLIERAYHLYFGCQIGDQDKSWAPHVCCHNCSASLRGWLRNKRNAMPFAVPMVWREPSSHIHDCYFCMTPPLRRVFNRRTIIAYPNIPSAIRPVPHTVGIPVPKAPEPIPSDNNMDVAVLDPSTSAEAYGSSSPPRVQRLSQSQLNDLVRDLQLPKAKAELLASRLKEWNVLDAEARICVYRTRQEQYVEFFGMDHGIAVCQDLDGLMVALEIQYDANEWWLFIDSSKTSLKAVLLSKKGLPSLPLAYATHLKETYETMKQLLHCINYDQHKWQICSDLKVVALLLGLQTGYTKYCCFLCEWDSRARASHYETRYWPLRPSLTPGLKNVVHPPLVETAKIILPPLHIKLGLMKNFVKALDKSRPSFQYLNDKFPRLSEAKLSEGIFVGPQIRRLIQDSGFQNVLSGNETTAWDAFKVVVKNFLGKTRAPTYARDVDALIEAYKNLGCKMSLKVHLLHSHLEFFPADGSAVSDEHGERFHQDIYKMEKRYQGNPNPRMLADYCWTLKKDVASFVYKRRATQS